MIGITQMWTRSEQLAALAFAREELSALQSELEAIVTQNAAGKAADMARMILSDVTEQELLTNQAIVALATGSWPIMFRSGIKRLMKTLMIMHGATGIAATLHRDRMQELARML